MHRMYLRHDNCVQVAIEWDPVTTETRVQHGTAQQTRAWCLTSLT